MQRILSFILVIMVFLTGSVCAETAKNKPTEGKPKAAPEWFMKGQQALSTGNYDEAIQCFTQSKDLDPSFANAYYFLGKSYSMKGMLDDAVNEYKKAIAIAPKAAITYAELGGIYIKKGMLDEAMNVCEKAIAIDNSNAVAHFNVGYIYNKRGNNSLAAKHLYRAGLLYLHRNDKNSALEAYKYLQQTNVTSLEQSLYRKIYPEAKQKKSGASK
jgi:tetratricopeptide (TPR) repeat protein